MGLHTTKKRTMIRAAWWVQWKRASNVSGVGKALWRWTGWQSVFLLVGLFMMGMSVGRAQQCDSPYQVLSIPYSWVNLPNPTVVTLGDDQLSSGIAIPFPFRFFNQAYNTLYICSNGFITFSPATCSYIAQNIPSAVPPNNIVAGYWEDLLPPGGGTISYDVIGTAPNRVFIVEFDSVPHWGFLSARVTFQIRLYEKDNAIEIHCRTCQSDGGWHTQGIENAAGNMAFALPGRVFANYSLTFDGVRFEYRASLAVSSFRLTGCQSGNDTLFVRITNVSAQDTFYFPQGVDSLYWWVHLTGAVNVSDSGFLTNDTFYPQDYREIAALTGLSFPNSGGYVYAQFYIDRDPNDVLGCDDTLRDTFYIPPVVSLPQVVDFTGYWGTNLSNIANGWLEARGVGTPQVFGLDAMWLSSPWLGNSAHPNGTSASLNLGAGYATGEWILSPQFDITSPKVYVAFEIGALGSGGNNPQFESNDSVSLFVFTDCGINMYKVHTYAQNNEPSALGQKDTFFLLPWLGQRVYLGWYGTGGGNTNSTNPPTVYLDNLVIRKGHIDLIPIQMSSPLAQHRYCPGGGTVGVALQIYNDGDVPATNFQVRVEFETGETYTGTYNGILYPGQQDYVFLGSWQLPVWPPGDSLRVKAYILNYSEEDSVYNDTLITWVYFAYPQYTVQAPDTLPPLTYGTFTVDIQDNAHMVDTVYWIFGPDAFPTEAADASGQALWQNPGIYEVLAVICYCDTCDTLRHTVVVPGSEPTGLGIMSSGRVPYTLRVQSQGVYLIGGSPPAWVQISTADGKVLYQGVPTVCGEDCAWIRAVIPPGVPLAIQAYTSEKDAYYQWFVYPQGHDSRQRIE